MRVAVFTGNALRHRALISRLVEGFANVSAVIEEPSIVTGVSSMAPAYKEYFELLRSSEKKIFKDCFKNGPHADSLKIAYGSLAENEEAILEHIKDSDVIIVYGASYIKGALCQALIERRAINIHLGVSPYYRGSACNYWALRDGRPDLVGATLHELSIGLDSGDIFFHVLPEVSDYGPFDFGMHAADIAQLALINQIRNLSPTSWEKTQQDRSKEIRCSRISDFNDSEAKFFLEHKPQPSFIKNFLIKRSLSEFVRPLLF